MYIYTLYSTDTVIIGQQIQQIQNNIQVFVMNKLILIQNNIQNFIVDELTIIQNNIQIHIGNLIVILETNVCEKIALIEEKLDGIHALLETDSRLDPVAIPVATPLNNFLTPSPPRT